VIIIPTNPLEITLPAVILGKILGVRVVPNIMEYEPVLPSFNKKKSVFFRWSWALITKYSDAYIVISRFLEEKMKQLSDKAVFRLPAILPPKNTNKEKSSSNSVHTITDALPDKIPTLIYASSKAYDDLLLFCLDALSQLGDKEFYIAITGEYSSVTQQLWMEKTKVMGLDGKVGFTGFLSDDEMYQLQIHSKALLMPLLDNDRHRARFPQKILGYMRLGKPVITTKVGELGEYFEDKVTVLMDESVTAHGYSEKIRFLLDYPDQADEIGLRGSAYVESRFNESTLGRQLAKFLISLGS
jgi:glycosyltransferase involved in cell wall biosynthesis